MASNHDLLAALAPVTERRRAARESMGAVAMLALAGKGIAAGLRFMSSGKGKQYAARLQKRLETRAQRARRYKFKFERSTDPAAKARWKRRWERAQARVDDAALTQKLAQSGIVGEGPVLEYKRNLLALEWEDPETTPDRKKQIEGAVLEMDKRLKVLAREAKALAATVAAPEAAPAATPAATAATGSAQRVEWVRGAADKRGAVIGDAGTGLWRRRLRRNQARGRGIVEDLDRALVSGVGGMEFDALSPPGPGRLVRIPFYPELATDSWSAGVGGAGGIEFPGDDPILNLPIAVGARTAGPFRMITERFDYGSYRILGLQTNEQGSYPTTDNPIGPGAQLGDVAITVAALSLYNGQELFLQDREQEIPSGTFAILPTWRTQAPNAGGLLVEQPYNYLRRRSRFFMGFRDYPVVSGTADVQILVRAFTTVVNPGPGAIEVPFSCNLVAELVEDKVFGDPVFPSPSGRPGAMVKVAAREAGLSEDLKDRVELVSSRRRRKLLGG